VSLPALFLFEKPFSCFQTKPFFVQTALYLTDNELFEPLSINFAVRMMIPFPLGRRPAENASPQASSGVLAPDIQCKFHHKEKSCNKIMVIIPVQS
jgi:hypothetical protein